MSSMNILDKMTEVSLDALWKIKVQECIDAHNLVKENPVSDISDDIILSNMEEGILPPKPEDLPMPPPYWLV